MRTRKTHKRGLRNTICNGYTLMNEGFYDREDQGAG